MIDDCRLKTPNEKAITSFFEHTKMFGRPIMITQTGSRAYGLETETSDFDFRGCLIPNMDYLLGLKTVEQVKIEGDCHVCHDIRQFIKIALRQNPTILEMLFMEPIYKTALWDRICTELRKTITKKAFLPYNAYVMSQMRKGKSRQPIGKRKEGVDALGMDAKFVSHVARLAVQCKSLMETGIIPIVVPEPHRTQIRAIKEGVMPKEEAFMYCEKLNVEMYEAYKASKLPESFDINAFERDFYIPLMKDLVESASVSW